MKKYIIFVVVLCLSVFGFTEYQSDQVSGQEHAQALVVLKRAYQDVGIRQVSQVVQAEQDAYRMLSLKPDFKGYFWIKRVVMTIPILVVQILCLLVLIWIAVILIRCWRWQEIVSKDKKTLKRLVFIGFIGFIVGYLHQLFLEKNKAIVVQRDILVYAGPEQTFHVVGTLGYGSIVQVLQSKEAMKKIQHKNMRGWIVQDAVECINIYE